MYATDVKFQPANKPSGAYTDKKKYFSNKHKLYGVKLEASVAYPGYCVALSRHYEGPISDFTIFTERKDQHLTMLQKSPDERRLEDTGEGSEKFPAM